MFNLTFICLDTETTGLDETAEIIEIGMVKVVNGEIVDRFNQLIKPLKPIPENITQITGIDNDMVSGQPSWNEVEQQILDFIGEDLLVAHNVSFDRGMLERHLGRVLPNSWLDTHDVAKIFLPSLTSYKLISIAGALEVEGNGFHRALSDAEITAGVLLKLIEKGCSVDPFTLQKVITVFQPDDTASPSSASKEESGLILLLTLMRAYVTGHAVTAAPQTSSTESETSYDLKPLLSFDQVQQFFEPEGLLNQANPDFQYRPQQIGMLNTIVKAFKRENHGIIEAGTGTGKSFAYLLPSLLWAYENNCRVVVSTNTIALQEQLYHKDIPFLKKCLNFDFPVALSKGRANYLCVRRFEQYKRQAANMPWPEKIFVAQIIYWLTLTEQGDRETLNLNKLEQQYWSNIASQSETCLNNQCSSFRRCFYMNNRKQCERSMLIITNHALLLQNMKLENQILPEFSHVVVDEAHNLEDEATRQFTDTVDLEMLRKSSKQLLRSNSIVNRILTKVRNESLNNEARDDLELLYRELHDDIDVLEQHIKEAINYVFTIPQLAHGNEYRITAKERESSWWQTMVQYLTPIANLLTAITHRLSRMRHLVDLFEDFELLAKELVFTQNWYGEQNLFLVNFLQEKRPRDIYWLDYQQSSWGSNLCLSVAPIDVMPLLKEYLFEQNDSVIMTSATLAITNNLRYTAELYLLQPEEYLAYITPSPFAYEEQSRIVIPTDIVDYSQVGEEKYTAMIIESLTEVLTSVEGGVLVLFTSYAMLNKVYFALKKKPELAKLNILAHGQDGSRTSILQNLNQQQNTVVLGASSFWEGVDIKGTGLTTLVITKLPFQPPTRPIISAKMEYIQSKGQNSFSQYSLPQAILRFRQGCGRLIRTADDWGAIVILDKRILTKNYGRDFINSLPKQPVLKKPLQEICVDLSQWMNKMSK